MNITAMILTHWYLGCGLIAVLFRDALVLHANIVNNVPLEEIKTSKISEVVTQAHQIGIAMTAEAQRYLGQSVADEVINQYEQAKAMAQQCPPPPLKHVVSATPISEQGS